MPSDADIPKIHTAHGHAETHLPRPWDWIGDVHHAQNFRISCLRESDSSHVLLLLKTL
jgi:hypothetical protein